MRKCCLLKHNVVVYGGHASWLKNIKPILKDAKFVLREAKPSAEQMRNADMVWIQWNALSHASYKKIRSVAMAYNIPIYYFAFGSAEKCAAQLVAVDEAV